MATAAHPSTIAQKLTVYITRISACRAVKLLRHRMYLFLDKQTPILQAGNKNTTGIVVAFPVVGGLHQRYERIVA